MALLIIDRELCIGCEACVDACAFDAIHLDEQDIAVANENCTACGACIDECPTEALHLPGVETPIIITPDLGEYEGVWFWVEQFEGQAGSISWEMAGKGRQLADQLGVALTACVLGSGVDVVYPAENRRLMERIIEGGAVLSEYALGTPPEASNFPPRNRIISGLSLGAVIVEAGARSGALITADYAAEQGRDVFAVPGNMFNRGSLGCNRLIQQGAKLILGVEDILEELNLTMVSQQQELQAIVPENETESLVLNLLSTEPLHVDELVRQTDLSVSEVSSTLALMELKGMIRQVGGMKYVLARESRPAYVVD